MNLVELKEPFFSLPRTGLREFAATREIREIDGFTLDSSRFEREIALRNGGLDLEDHSDEDTEACMEYLPGLESLEREKTLEDTTHYEKLSPFARECGARNFDALERMLSRYDGVKAPCSMIVRSLAELEKHILRAFQVSHAHYVLARKRWEDFPRFCCGTSGRNVELSLISHGYPNATYTTDEDDDHGYVLLPFLFVEEGFDEIDGIEGMILVDPTSDQLFEHPSKRKRNLVRVHIGTDWEYRTDWKNGANLFPTGALSLDMIRRVVRDVGDTVNLDYLGYREFYFQFLRIAFENPVDITRFTVD